MSTGGFSIIIYYTAGLKGRLPNHKDNLTCPYFHVGNQDVINNALLPGIQTVWVHLQPLHLSFSF
ncbi:hypothetical protein CLV42_11895 [Chitinophaga ginsengisoli]|uniref:Uncharacterized protein n=1 Tax=Chitinophaga ginsengisoli TaxID=363837 RepID=A0A2P8FNS9_9BACT|nr:hypothetical protein CLV42_11895 [Chitinophaga ginsengisoli]